MPSNTLLKFTSPCSNVGKDTSARSAALPLLWALRSSLAILAGLNRFGPWKGNTGSSMFKFRTFDKDFSQVYWHIDQAWPGKSRNTENKHPFKSPTGWANQLSKTESEHYTNNQKQTKHNSDPSLEFFLFGMPVTMRTPISPATKNSSHVPVKIAWKAGCCVHVRACVRLVSLWVSFASFLTFWPSCLPSSLPCWKRAYYVKHCQTHVSGARVHASAAQAQTTSPKEPSGTIWQMPTLCRPPESPHEKGMPKIDASLWFSSYVVNNAETSSPHANAPWKRLSTRQDDITQVLCNLVLSLSHNGTQRHITPWNVQTEVLQRRSSAGWCTNTSFLHVSAMRFSSDLCSVEISEILLLMSCRMFALVKR